MPKFSSVSLVRLNSCHPDLVKVMNEVIKKIDIAIICGHRNKADQDKAFAEGKSKLKFPNSKHNSLPSRAVDIAPYPIKWNDVHGFKEMAAVVIDTANSLGVKLRWGGAWNGKPNTGGMFNDFPHFELI